MQTVEAVSLPHVLFAHVYGTVDYRNVFFKQSGRIEVTYIEQGSMIYDDGNTVVTAEQGDVICNLFSKTITVTSHGFHRHHTVVAEMDWQRAAQATGGLLLPLITPCADQTAPIRRLIDRFAETLFVHPSSSTQAAAAFLELLCTIDACNRKQNKPLLPAETVYASRAKEAVFSRMHLPVSQRQIAAQLGITPEYLCTVFKKAEGVSFIKYCNTAKLQAIRVLMEKEGVPLYRAAAMYGYSDANYVSKLFKKYFGYNITDGL